MQGQQVQGKREPGVWSCKGSLHEEGSLNNFWKEGAIGQGEGKELTSWALAGVAQLAGA